MTDRTHPADLAHPTYPIRPHHRQAIDRLVAHYRDDPVFPALIVGGSIVKGWARDDSDVDFMLVASDEEFARRQADRATVYYSPDFTDYDGGYVDGKIVDRAFLEEVAARGSEPARAAFEGVLVGYSRLPDLEDLLARIVVYPEADRQRKMQSFHAQLQAWQWYVGEAERRANRYLLFHTVSQLVLFGGRLILAHNRVLYPYHKWFMNQLARVPDQPSDLFERIDALLANPGKAEADRFCECILGFKQWEPAPEGWPARFLVDSEWTWRTGCAPVADW
jgi:hypothetical protein